MEKEVGALHADIRLEDSQDIQVLQDKLYQALLCLTMNRHVIQEIEQKQCKFLSSEEELDHTDRYLLGSLATEASMALARLESILKRAEGTQKLVRGAL
jgi:hypothetical protein